MTHYAIVDSDGNQIGKSHEFMSTAIKKMFDLKIEHLKEHSTILYCHVEPVTESEAANE